MSLVLRTTLRLRSFSIRNIKWRTAAFGKHLGESWWASPPSPKLSTTFGHCISIEAVLCFVSGEIGKKNPSPSRTERTSFIIDLIKSRVVVWKWPADGSVGVVYFVPYWSADKRTQSSGRRLEIRNGKKASGATWDRMGVRMCSDGHAMR